MKTNLKTLMGRVAASLVAVSLATGLVPAADIAFAQESTTGIINQSVPLTVSDDDAADAALLDEIKGQIEGDHDHSHDFDEAEHNHDADVAVKASASTSVTASSSAGYTSNAIDRVSADVPVNTAAPTVVGNVEYEGLTYRINDDGKSASLVGLGSSAAKGDLNIPNQIASGGALYKVTNIGTSKSLGGGGRHFCAI